MPLSHHLTHNCLGLNASFRGKRPVNNRLTHGTAPPKNTVESSKLIHSLKYSKLSKDPVLTEPDDPKNLGVCLLKHYCNSNDVHLLVTL